VVAVVDHVQFDIRLSTFGHCKLRHLLHRVGSSSQKTITKQEGRVIAILVQEPEAITRRCESVMKLTRTFRNTRDKCISYVTARKMNWKRRQT
jgi:hypothetical protein